MSFAAVAIGGIGLGLVGSVGKIFGAGKANKELGQLKSQIPTYQSSPYASQRLGMAETMLNARMPGSAEIQNNIYGNQANQMANINRNATSSSQALALGAATQGATNQAFEQEGLDQNQYHQQQLQNLTGAQEGMINEGDKVYQSQQTKFGDTAQIEGAQNQNNQNAWGSIANLGFGMADLGVNGGLRKNQGTQTPSLF